MSAHTQQVIPFPSPARAEAPVCSAVTVLIDALCDEADRIPQANPLNAHLPGTMPVCHDCGTASHAAYGVQRLHKAGSAPEFLTRPMHRAIGEETARLEWGLAVAIPAVLAYNDCARGNRLVLAKLDAYSHDC